MQRVDPKNFGYDTRLVIKNNPHKGGPFNLSPRNRELVLDYYKKLKNEGIALARLVSVIGVISRLLVMLEKDFDKATRQDIEELINKINERQVGAITRQDYLKKIKQLDKWLNGGLECSPRTRWIKTGLGKKHFKLPSQLVTPQEVTELLNASENIRDRALIHLLWESGARIGEVINMKISSVAFNKGEARIRLSGKVGERQVLLLESVHDLNEHFKTRQNANENDPLFVLVGNRNKGQPMSHQAINGMLQDTKEKTNIKKHIHAYLFRHSRASYLASQGLNEAQLCMIFGWTIGSKQPATYIHLSGAQVENAYKKLYGMDKDKITTPQLVKCTVCGEMNPSTNDGCQNCFNPLTIQGALKVRQEKELLEHDRDISQKVFTEAFRLISEKKFTPEDAQKEAIQTIAKQYTQQQTKTGVVLKSA